MSKNESSLGVNTMAVAFIKKNQNAQAISCFLEGLRNMLDMEREAAEMNSHNDLIQFNFHRRKNNRRRKSSTRNEQYQNSSSSSSSSSSSCIHVVKAPEIKNKEMEVSPDSTFAMFNRALVIFEPISPVAAAAAAYSGDGSCSTYDDYSYDLIMSVFLYNLGLVYHREGVERHSSAALRKALYVYECAGAALSRSRHHVPSPSYNVVMFGIVNNVGHIHAHLFHRPAAERSRDYLVRHVTRYQKLLSRADYAYYSMHFLLSGTADLQALAPAA